VLGTFVATIVFSSIYHIVARSFYAHQDTRTPLLVSFVAVGANIGCAVLFSEIGFGPEGLAAAMVISAALEVVILLIIQQRRSRNLLLNSNFWKEILRILGATAICGAISYSMTKFFPLMASDDSFFVTFPKFTLITIIILTAYAFAGYFLKVGEIRPVLDKIKRIVFRK
jgi:putative peptidoglycan lipid II flippase